MKILLTNDDGIYADGVWVLKGILSSRHNVTVVCPEKECSGFGHAITISGPIQVTRIQKAEGEWGYAVAGTPADCVKLGVHELLEARPDIVISGINSGANVGADINYSGTVSAAREAAMIGIPAVAVSQDRGQVNENGYRAAAKFVSILIEQMMERGLPSGVFLNVNLPGVPLSKINGVKITRQCVMPIVDTFQKWMDTKDRTWYLPLYENQDFTKDPRSDRAALYDNSISITPLRCDLTDYDEMERLKTWRFLLGTEKNF
nr:5'/3'-nucleotidase SurE [Desulfobacterales bacterium]